MTTYEEEHPFEKRQIEAANILSKYSDRLPVICQRHSRSTSVPLLDKRKFLVPRDLTVGQFLYVIRTRLKLNASHAIFLMTADGSMPSSSTVVHMLYDAHKSEDGFLYFVYSGENTFGMPRGGETLHASDSSRASNIVFSFSARLGTGR